MFEFAVLGVRTVMEMTQGFYLFIKTVSCSKRKKYYGVKFQELNGF